MFKKLEFEYFEFVSNFDISASNFLTKFFKFGEGKSRLTLVTANEGCVRYPT